MDQSQWINPKGLVAAFSAIAIYLRPGHEARDLGIMPVVFGVVTASSVTTWASFGVALRHPLRDPDRARLFDTAMGLLLAASIVPMLLEV